MSVIIPNPRICARWNGALQLRLRHSPLEAFMRSRGLKWVAAGETRITDNLAAATIYVVNKALDVFPGGRVAALVASRQAAVGQVACAVSSNLALLIQEPTYWRTGALVATARLLEKRMGLSGAAHLAAAAAREYSNMTGNGSTEVTVLRIGHGARLAVETNDAADETAALELICSRLSAIAASPPSTVLRSGTATVFPSNGITYQV